MSEKIRYAGFSETEMHLRRRITSGGDFALSLSLAIRGWDPDMRNPFTAEEARKVMNGEKIEFKQKTVGEVNLSGSTLALERQRIIRLVDDRSLHYYRLYLGEKRVLDSKNEELRLQSRGITICDKQEIEALKTIFTSDEVNKIISGSKSREEIVKEVALAGCLGTEQAPRIARLVKDSDGNFHLQIGEKRVLDSRAEWIPRNVSISKNELFGLKTLLEDISFSSAEDGKSHLNETERLQIKHNPDRWNVPSIGFK